MGNKYNTQGKRIREMNNVLDIIKNNNATENNIINQGSSILATLVDPNGDDALIKEKLMQCSNQIFSSANELQKIDSRYYMHNSYINNWIKPIKIDLLRYVPDCIKEIKSADGQVYDNNITDLYCCFALLCKYGEKPYVSGENIKTTSRSNNYFKRDYNFYHIDPEKKAIYNYYVNRINEVEAKIREAEAQIEAQRERARKAREDARRNRNPWKFITNFLKDMKARQEEERVRSMERNFDLGSKRFYVSILKMQLRLFNPKEYGCFYDDNYLLQRTKQKVTKKKIEIVTGVNVKKGAWGKIKTEQKKEEILQEYQEDPVDTSYYPEMPNLNEYKNFVLKRSSFGNKNCLAYNIELLRSLISMRWGEPDEGTMNKYYFYFDQLKKSYNTINEISKVYGENKDDEEYYYKNSYNDVSFIIDTIPDVLYYEPKDDNMRGMLLQTHTKLINYDPRIKEIYNTDDKYKAVINVDTDGNNIYEIVKDLVYDEEEFGKYYKDYKYRADVSFEEIYSNLINKDEIITPTLSINNECYKGACEQYKNKIVNNIKDLKKGSGDEKSIGEYDGRFYYCEDYEPLEHYEDFYFYLSTLKLLNEQQCDAFIDYCLDVIKPWYINRVSALYNSTIDSKNTEMFYKLLRKRLKKNSGSLLIWYQSLISFDNTYQDFLDTKKIIEGTTNDILVTTGNSTYHEDSFNNIKNCSYIDIEDPDKIYDRKNFNSGDKVFIVRGMKEQINYISRIEKIYVEDSTGINIVNTCITRLHLNYRLKDWCYVEDPTKVMIAKLL